LRATHIHRHLLFLQLLHIWTGKMRFLNQFLNQFIVLGVGPNMSKSSVSSLTPTWLVIRDRHQTLGPTASHLALCSPTTRRGRRLLVNPSPRIQINWLFLVFFVLRGSKWRPWLLQLPQLESCGIIAFLSSASLFCLNPRDIQGKVSVYLWVLLYEFWLSACEGFQEQTSKHLSSFTPNADKSQLSGLDVTGSACWCCMSEISL